MCVGSALHPCPSGPSARACALRLRSLCRSCSGPSRPARRFDRVYGVREATLVETCQRLTYNSDGPYQATGTPKSLDHKFIAEDVPTDLVPMSAIGAAARVKTPAIDALVEMVRNMTGKDFATEGRTLERLGLRGMDAVDPNAHWKKDSGRAAATRQL